MAIKLNFDGDVAQIIGKMDKVENGLVGVRDGYDDVAQASKDAIGGATDDQKRLASATKKTDLEFDRQGKTMRQLSAHVARLSKGQKKVNDPKLVKKYNTEIAKTRGALAQMKTTGATSFKAVNGAATASTGIFRVLGASIKSALLPLAAGAAVFQALSSIVSENAIFEQTAADLEAITGASGETLEFLKQSAVEAGIETTASAVDTLEAYKLIASNKPELLSNAAALAELTREAITLTETFGGDLPTVAQNLTDIMNKFKLPASEAARVVNALAAGSKEGSADVSNLAASFLQSGTALRSANVSIEEGVGVLEALAENGTKGAEAGTALRNVLSKLSATDVLPKDAADRLKAAGVDMSALSDKSLTFADRLAALKPIQDDANALVAVFGLENKDAALDMIQSTERIKELTLAVTDTSVATDQAATRTATMSAEWIKFKNTIAAVVVDGGGGLTGFLALVIRFARHGVLFLKEAFDQIAQPIGFVFRQIGGLVEVFRKLLPVQNEAGQGARKFGDFIAAMLSPLKLVFTLLGFATQAIAIFAGWLIKAAKSSSTLRNGFARISTGLTIMQKGFIDLPAYVVGAFNSIRVFIKEVGSSIAQLGRNVGNVFAEMFDITELITNGTDALNGAITDLTTNTFKGVGTKAAQAFTDGFNATKELLKVPAAVVAPDATGSATPTGDVPDPTAPAAAIIDADALAKKAAKELKSVQDLERLKIDAMKDGVEKQLALEDLRFADLKTKLEKFGVETESATEQHENNKLNIRTSFITKAADLEQLAGEDRAQFIFDQTTAEIDAIETALRKAGDGKLIAEQTAQINLLRKNAADAYLTEVETIHTKEAKAALDHEIALLELRRGEFETQKDFEVFKTEEILNIRLKAAEAQIALIEAVSGAENGAALSLRKTINEIKGQIASLQGDTAKEFNLFRLIGLDPDDPENKGIIKGIQVAAATAMDTIQQVQALRLKAAEARIKESDEEIDRIDDEIEAKENELKTQIDRSDRGLANTATARRQELADLKAARVTEAAERAKAFADKKKIQKQQIILDGIAQASNLITSATEVFKAVSKIPIVGVPLGIALVGTMIGGFIAAKASAFNAVNSQKAEKGAAIIGGERHSKGGTMVEAEKGEAMGILSRPTTNREGGKFIALTNALNAGRSFDETVAILTNNGSDFESADVIKDSENEIIILKQETQNNSENSLLKENNALLRESNRLSRKKSKKVDYVGKKKIVTIGNSTRIIKK